jgi:hypothetical protein
VGSEACRGAAEEGRGFGTRHEAAVGSGKGAVTAFGGAETARLAGKCSVNSVNKKSLPLTGVGDGCPVR